VMSREVNLEDLQCWLVKLCVFLEKQERKILKRKRRKLFKLISHVNQKSALDRLDEHKMFFTFKNDLSDYGKGLFDDFENLVNLSFISAPAPLNAKKPFYLMILTLFIIII